jgi:hypothetical protein
MLPPTTLDFDVAPDRDRQLEHHRLLIESRLEQGRRPSNARRLTALTLAAFSRGSAAAVRRLDDCVADDLSRSLAPTK